MTVKQSSVLTAPPDEGEVFVPRTLVFGQEDALACQAAGYNVGCFRIPAVLQTSDGVILGPHHFTKPLSKPF